MDTLISLKNWPDEAEFGQQIQGILENIGFSNLETSYDLTSYREIDDQLDSWWIKDTKADKILFYLVLGNDLGLTAELVHGHPALEWAIEQVCHRLALRDDTITGEKYPERTYMEWCKANWIGVSTAAAFEQRYQAEQNKYQLPSLDPLYSEI